MGTATMPRLLQRDGEPMLVGTVWQLIKQQLEAKKAANRAEILTYPRPITACDAQFNYLLEERNHIAQEMQLAETAMQEQATGEAALNSIRAFVNSSRYVNETMLGSVDMHRVAAAREPH